MKIGILQTAPNNCEALDRLFARYPQVQVVHYVDECVWEYVLAAGGVVTSQCHDILAGDFNKSNPELKRCAVRYRCPLWLTTMCRQKGQWK